VQVAALQAQLAQAPAIMEEQPAHQAQLAQAPAIVEEQPVVVTPQQQQQEQPPQQPAHKQYNNVTFNDRDNKYAGKVSKHYIAYQTPNYVTAEEAARAVDR
jgi:predicted amidohydrolase